MGERISIDYEEAMAQARELERAADECAESIRSIKQQSAESEHCLIGNTGDAIRNKAAELTQDLKRAETKLRSTAQKIRRVASELKEEDERLAAMAGSSGYSKPHVSSGGTHSSSSGNTSGSSSGSTSGSSSKASVNIDFDRLKKFKFSDLFKR